MSISALAQEIRPDTIYQKDLTKIEVKVVEVTDSLVLYQVLEEINAPVNRLNRDLIIKIVYGNGVVEVFSSSEVEKLKVDKITQENKDSVVLKQKEITSENKKVVSNKIKKPTRSKRQSIVKANQKVGEQLSKQVEKEEKKPQLIIAKTDSVQPLLVKHKVKEKKNKYRPRAILSLAAEKSKMLTGALEEETISNYDEGYGGLLQFQYNVSNRMGLKLSSGYMQWSRKDSVNPTQSTVSTFRTMPLMLGIKHYYNRVVYLTLEGGVAAQKTSIKTFENELKNKNWQLHTSDYTFQPSAALSLGAEVKITKLVLDVSPYFQWLYTEGTEYGTYYAGLRVGIGLAMGKRKDW
ncbi:hypothetical protein AAE02nite_18260 [Adhaeribacter aerolatus]|uniref:Outer membrane protein beta-barrel domain-containing protein n=1 Tax=Adhaeribacter aerolatus TaxID=670289 RepID=A0A512AWR6_9BACT|nr:hypothetical protein AAE02nite_18260 [Adhaeribacter aerolatus]